jgi:futalosine hydrolase
MKILIVSATKQEIELLVNLQGSPVSIEGKRLVFRNYGHEIHVVTTGTGMVATAYSLGRLFAVETFDVAVNAGICGSFNHNISIGEVVNVVSDSFADMGAENRDSWLTMSDLGLTSDDKKVFTENGTLTATGRLAGNLMAVNSVTVNTVHGNAESIRRFCERTNADVESMEGAAFFYACALAGCKSVQIRSVSNYVEPRDTSKWMISEAIENLNQELITLLSNEWTM